jgi:microcystin-dependent protein
MNVYLGMIVAFGGNFNPRQFQLCAGQIIPISINTALFSLLGTNYGGNGTSNFGLPDLRGRAAVNQGQGPGLSDYVIGEQTGMESNSLLVTNIPAHSHLVNSLGGFGNVSSPSGAMFAEGPKKGSGPSARSPEFYTNGTPSPQMLNPTAITPSQGGNTRFSVLQPTLAISYIIATSGVFPPRN